MTATHVSWMFELRVNEGREAELRALMAEMSEATERNEPATLEYEWHLSDDGRVHLWERYEDEAAALLHLRTFGARFATRFFECMRPERIVVYGASGSAGADAVRAAMGELRPPVLIRAAGFSRHRRR